jgi:uncharacterized lipoprotein YmbA
MNRTFETGTSSDAIRSRRRTCSGAAVTRLAALILAITLGAGLAGCGFLRPARPTTRQFVLTPLPATEPATATSHSVAVGLGKVNIASYLFNMSLAVRQGPNEIRYSTEALWAERLNAGLQRVLAANLATLLSTDQIRLSVWRSEEVAAEVFVTFDRFDVDTDGKAVLVAWWRILAPGGEKTLKSGEARLIRQGPSPDPNPSRAVATLSDLVGELSRQIAQALKETTPLLRSAPVAK